MHNKSNSFNRQSISLDLLNLKNIEVFIENNKKYDTCIFLVGLAHRKGEKSDYQEFNSINFKTFKNLLDTFVKYKKIPNKIIFASTISIYGEKLRTNKYTESHLPNPKTPYAITKLKAENYLKQNFASKYWILRLAPVYSKEFLLNIERRTEVFGKKYVIGGGNKKLSLCHLDNINSLIESIIFENKNMVFIMFRTIRFTHIITCKNIKKATIL